MSRDLDLVFDEFANLSIRQWEVLDRIGRKKRAVLGWPNWYINRGRLSLDPTKSELRRVSWRRAK